MELCGVSSPEMCDFTRKLAQNYALFRAPFTQAVEKQVNVVYEVPCMCGMVCNGETKRCLRTKLKEHKDACARCQTEKSAIAERAWSKDHPINWNGTKILRLASHTKELLMKEALCIQSTPADSHFNRDSEYELPDCLFALNRRLRGRAIVGHRAP